MIIFIGSSGHSQMRGQAVPPAPSMPASLVTSSVPVVRPPQFIHTFPGFIILTQPYTSRALTLNVPRRPAPDFNRPMESLPIKTSLPLDVDQVKPEEESHGEGQLERMAFVAHLVRMEASRNRRVSAWKPPGSFPTTHSPENQLAGTAPTGPGIVTAIAFRFRRRPRSCCREDYCPAANAEYILAHGASRVTYPVGTGRARLQTIGISY